MKIDKRNPIHWVLLAIFSINVILCLLLTVFQTPRKMRILLFGHKLNGNLKALYDFYQNDTNHEVFFLTLDPTYSSDLRKAGIHVLNATNPLDIYSVCQSRVIVTDHGPLSLILLIWINKYVFIDVWHGIPFKGFDAKDFRHHHHYGYTLVTSKLIKQFYTEKFGFSDKQVVVTGYGRTDYLVRKDLDPESLKKKYGLGETEKKIVLYAPTWNHNNSDHQGSPFGIEPRSFLEQLSSYANRNGIWFIYRSHLNVDLDMDEYSNIRFFPASTYPDTEELLYISDVLICDWSSIAFDFLLLERPVLFVDCEPPFKKGLTLDGEFRFGPLIKDMQDLLSVSSVACEKPVNILDKFEDKMLSVREAVYDNNADGYASKRYAEFIDSVA